MPDPPLPGDPDPLRHAATLAAHKALARSPDPASYLAEACAPCNLTIRTSTDVKPAFDRLQIAVSVVAGTRVTQSETLRWLVAFASARRDEFLAEVARSQRS